MIKTPQGIGIEETKGSAKGRQMSEWTVLVCPECGATSVDNTPYPVGKCWSRAGRCHLGRLVEPERYVPEGPRDAS